MLQEHLEETADGDVECLKQLYLDQLLRYVGWSESVLWRI